MEKKSGFVDAGFVKTCDELVIGPQNHLHDHQRLFSDTLEDISTT